VVVLDLVRYTTGRCPCCLGDVKQNFCINVVGTRKMCTKPTDRDKEFRSERVGFRVGPLVVSSEQAGVA